MGVGVIICLGRGADLHMASWCHCHSLSLASVKSRLVLVPAHLGNPGQSPEGHKTDVCVCYLIIYLLLQFTCYSLTDYHSHKYTDLAKGDRIDAFGVAKSIVPSSKTVFPGRNFMLFGFGVSCIWMKTDLAAKKQNNHCMTTIKRTQASIKIKHYSTTQQSFRFKMVTYMATGLPKSQNGNLFCRTQLESMKWQD